MSLAKLMTSKFLTAFLALSCPALAACGPLCADNNYDGLCDGSVQATASGGEPACVMCDDEFGVDGYRCGCDNSDPNFDPPDVFCTAESDTDDLNDAAAECALDSGTYNCVSSFACSGANATVPSYCSTWTPGAAVTLVGGIHYVAAGLVTGIENDPKEFINCDRVTTNRLTGGGFVLGGLDAGDTLYALGLRDGDVPLTLNGYSLDTYAEAALAIAVTYGLGSARFDLDVQRGSSTVGLHYVLVFT